MARDTRFLAVTLADTRAPSHVHARRLLLAALIALLLLLVLAFAPQHAHAQGVGALTHQAAVHVVSHLAPLHVPTTLSTAA